MAALSDLFDTNSTDSDWHDSAITTLRGAFVAAAATPGSSSTLAAYLYGLCQKQWEHSVDHPKILRVANATDETFGRIASYIESKERHLVELLIRLNVSLASCMGAENALNCSCPVDMKRHAVAAAEVGRVIVEECAGHLVDEKFSAYDFLMQAAGAQSEYFGALARVAHATELFIADRRNSGPVLRKAIAAVHRAERSEPLRGDVYESELRSHRLTLEAMASLLDAPILRVDDGRIYYCYPFAVLGLTAGEVLERLTRIPRQWPIGRATVLDVDELTVTDAWDSSDPQGRSYGGVAVALADLEITSTSGDLLPPHHIEVRATTIGTCYVRISTSLQSASMHELNQAMRRGSAHMGDEQIRQGPATWHRLSEYVEEVIESIEQLLDDGRGTTRIIFSVQRRHHTVLSVRALSVIDSSEHRVSRYEEIQSALGARLFGQRINQALATLEEYVRTPNQQPNTILRDVSFEGEVIICNPESTVIMMPTTPNFVVMCYEEMIEFSASLPALLDRWTTAIFEQRRGLSSHLPSLEAVLGDEPIDRRSGNQLVEQVNGLERRQASLRRLVAEAQSILAFVKSPALCQTAKYRQILDNLFMAASVPRLELDLEAQIAQVDALYLHVQTLFQIVDEREQRRYRRLVEVVLAFLAVTSSVDFFSLINSATEDWRVLLEVGTVLTLGALVALVALRSTGRKL